MLTFSSLFHPGLVHHAPVHHMNSGIHHGIREGGCIKPHAPIIPHGHPMPQGQHIPSSHHHTAITHGGIIHIELPALPSTDPYSSIHGPFISGDLVLF